MTAHRPSARIGAISSALPGRDIDGRYRDWAADQLPPREARLFARMQERGGIAHRWTVLDGADARMEPGSFYAREHPPTTGERMAIYAEAAPALALQAIRGLGTLPAITHLVVASCTGFIAPGVDQLIARRLGLNADVERVMIGFMGCYAGSIALRTARHIVRSEPDARVLVITVELCSLHLQHDTRIEPLLAMAQFGDGAAAALVTAEGPGLELGPGLSLALEESADLITWRIADTGFVMELSGEVPARIATALGNGPLVQAITAGVPVREVDAWAVHAGGRSILDAVERGLGLDPASLAPSREVLHANGNVSSATLLFVLEKLFRQQPARAIALAFVPGLAVEGFRFGWTDGEHGPD